MTVNAMIPIWLMVFICLGLAALVLIRSEKKFPVLFRRLLMIVLVFMINLKMVIPGHSPSVKINSSDVYVLFVIDDTISMIAEDYAGDPTGEITTRLEAVSADCDTIIEGLLGAKFGLVTFNNAGYISSPFTDNITHISSVISSIYPLDSANARGTTLNVAKETMLTVLQDNYENKGKQTIVFFISDGEITDETSTLESFAELAPYICDGAVLGYGSSTGGVMNLKNAYYDTTELITDYYTGETALSYIDEDNLRRVASDLGISYINMNNGNSLDSFLSRMVADNGISYDIETTVDVTGEYTDDTPVYLIFVIPLALLMLWEFAALRRRR